MNVLGCISKDTELLTPMGWINIAEVTQETTVAQYFVLDEIGRVGFTKPNYLSNSMIEKAYRLVNYKKHVDQLIASHHCVLYNTYSNALIVTPSSNDLPIASKIINSGYLINPVGGVITADERIKVAIQADGRISKRSKRTDGIIFRLKKPNKLDRIQKILANDDVNYKTYASRIDGCSAFVYLARPDYYDKHFDWLDLTHVDYKWCMGFIDELSRWDSTVRKNENKGDRIQYYNCDVPSVNRAQAVAVLVGYRTCLSGRDRKPDRWNVSHTLSISDNRGVLVEQVKKILVDYNDIMYTVGVPSGFLITRRNNCVSVVPCFPTNKPYRMGKMIMNACPID